MVRSAFLCCQGQKPLFGEQAGERPSSRGVSSTGPRTGWAVLARGDVVTLGRRVGEPVLLRVGGIPVARGDLVEIDGEVGVRIVERLAEDVAKR